MKRTKKLKRLAVTRETIRPLADARAAVGGADPATTEPAPAVLETRNKSCTCDGCGRADPVAY